ncbi:Glutamate or tyrosine decarboxylase [Spirosomataceae bacterium TFI 002]|nr:Glutamate or tyrosine decarboxylase [Spirosomataceae bacterium TFI 002]
MKFWKKKSSKEIQDRISKALSENRSFYDEPILGMPASHLDSKIFPNNNPILKDAPFLQTLINNPNHIGCHTIAQSESTFAGTQEIEKQLLNIIACDIFKANENEYDGYVASGGTEANMQAVWIYREYFKKEKGAKQSEIAVFCSTDTHYSLPKACNVLSLDLYKIQVDDDTREMSPESISATLDRAKSEGKKYIIFTSNMMTTMFGSVDDIDMIAKCLKESELEYKIHIDGAYGGFFYPFAQEESILNFENPEVSSITVDAHKMVQAPYGTGIFLIRKGFMKYTHSKDASYVKGEDYTLVGSRSGANAIAVWMILSSYGSYGWAEKNFVLKKRTDWLCNKLDKLNIEYFRHPDSNIVTIRAEYIDQDLAAKYYIVPDNHHNPKWYKIIVMEHVGIEHLELFLDDITIPA